MKLNGMTILDRNVRVSRVLSDPKNNRNLKTRKVMKKNYQSNNDSLTNVSKQKGDSLKSENKLFNKSKSKPEFQGQKSKPNVHKKVRTRQNSFTFSCLCDGGLYKKK